MVIQIKEDRCVCVSVCVFFLKICMNKRSVPRVQGHCRICIFLLICVSVHAVEKLTGLVNVAQQLGDFDEAGHCALRLLLQPLIVLPEALHLSLQHRLVLFLLKDIGTQQNKSRRSDRCGRNGRGATGTQRWR